ncbi:MAG: hypothetical protein AB1918_08865 [Pseudomonadota bacterium]
MAESNHDKLLAEVDARLDGAGNAPTLLTVTRTAIESALRRAGDRPHRDATLKAIEQYFAAFPADRIDHLRVFSKKAMRLVVQQRAGLPTVRALNTNHPLRRHNDVALTDAVAASDIEEPTRIVEVPPPPPVVCDSFEEMFPAAIIWRLRQVLTFFQRRNPDLQRELPVPFLLSPDFDDRFQAAIRDQIAPAMWRQGRTITVLGTQRKWQRASTIDFWAFVAEDPKRRERVVTVWDAAWTALRQQRTAREDKATGRFREVWLALPALKELRERLAPPTPQAYDMPPVRNRELELFNALLFEFNTLALESAWTKLRQIYEQEMDRRWYQDKARQGALRDSLLGVFEDLPDSSGEFMAILCYFNFPNMNLNFLERFTHNKGSNEAERRQKVPYLMRFLDHERVPEIRRQEMETERLRREALKVRKAS